VIIGGTRQNRRIYNPSRVSGRTKPLANTGLTPNLDLAPDGKRFAVLMPLGGTEATDVQRHVTLLMNFFDEPRRIAPTTTQK
jgi:hypothetical protein